MNWKDEFIKEIEKHTGKSWSEIEKQAELDTIKQKEYLKKHGDPIAKASKESSKSPQKMYKDSMKQLENLMGKNE